jgi:hypothetical protein
MNTKKSSNVAANQTKAYFHEINPPAQAVAIALH